jgi:hypothetical protein
MQSSVASHSQAHSPPAGSKTMAESKPMMTFAASVVGMWPNTTRSRSARVVSRDSSVCSEVGVATRTLPSYPATQARIPLTPYNKYTNQGEFSRPSYKRNNP